MNLNKFMDNIDLYIAIFIIISGLLLLTIGLYVDVIRLEQVSIILLASSTLYLLLRKKFMESKDSLMEFSDSKNLFLALVTIFFILYTVSIIIFYNTIYSRPLSYIVLSILMAGILGAQIFSTEEKKYYYLILFEILILGILVRTTIFYQFSTVVGGDSWVHLNSIVSILKTGHVTNAVEGYSAFPLMHIFTTIIGEITNIGIRNAMFILGLSEVIVIMFFYIVVKEVFNEKIGLLSALMVTLSTHYIQYGFMIIPQTFGLIFLIIIIFLVFYQQKIDNLYKKVVYTLLIFLFIMNIILSHTLTSFAALLILISIYLIDLFNKIHLTSQFKKEKNFISLTLITFFFVVLIYYWMFQSGLMGYVGKSLIWGLSVSYQGPSVSTLEESFLTTGMKIIPLYFAVFFALIGFFYSLNSKYFKTINIYGWPLLLFVFAAVFLSLNTFLPARWFVFLEIVLAVPMAVSIIAIARISPRKVLTIFLLVSIISLVFMTNYEANAQNVNPFTPYPTQAMKYSEMNVGILDKIPLDIQLYSDLGYRNPFLNRSVYDASDILSGKNELDGVILVRKDLEQNPYFSSSLGGGHYSVVALDPSVLEKIERIYDSGTIIVFEGEL